MAKPAIIIGDGKFATKDTKFLGYAQGDSSSRFVARELTYDRGSNITATRVASNGLIEKGRENLVHYSNNFATVSGGGGWGHSGINTISTGQDGYDGTTNATFIRASTASGKHQVTLGVAQSLPGTDFSITGVFTLSVHAKPNGYDHLILRSDRTNVNASFNIATGVVGTKGSECIESSMTAVGNGFYRCEATFAPGAATTFLAIGMMEADDTTDFTGSNSKGYILQDAQLEVGLVATSLISTSGAAGKAGILEDQARVDYLSNSNGYLLLEPTRQNKFANSEYMAGTFGTIRSTFTANAGISPEGVQNATAVFETATGVDGGASLDPVVASSHGFQKLDIDIDNGTFYSYSFFVKANGRSKFLVQHPTAATLNTSVTVDLSGTPSVTEGRGAATGSQSIVDYGDGWYRVEINGKEGLANDADGNLNFFFHNGTQTDYLGDVTKGLLFYGFQLEEGKICTSYIPTHGAAATRSTDNVAAFDTSGFSFGTTCTIFYEGVINEVPSSFIRPITMFNSHASPQTAERFLLFAGTFSSGTYTLTSRHNTGGATAGVVKSGLTVGAKVKCASVFNGTSQKFFVNGDLAGTDTITAASVFNSLDLSQIVADQNHTVGSIMLFNSAISDADAFVLTDTSYESYSEAADSLNYIQHG